jgi:1-deoxy-D-xylulose-5-phosphate synthase
LKLIHKKGGNNNMILDKLKSAKQIKRLSPRRLNQLAGELRAFLIERLSHTGGHLASNLGVVELTLALHYVFNSPEDKIIWDVGHQSYVHKILTGRRDKFAGLRQLDGLSGFPKCAESPHDVYETGHSSTSISAALGLAVARDLKGEASSIIAVIGDGSMTGGLAYEALNNAGRSHTDLLVILNDNQMSIAQNVGAVSRHLNDLRTAPLYLGAKRDIHKLLGHVPVVGKYADRFIEKTKDAVKSLLVPGVLFEELGFNYFGPVDGHDIKALTEVLRRIKRIKGPVLLHVLTTKGKGYNQAEHAPEEFHGVGSFTVKTGEPTQVKISDSYTDVFGKALVKQAQDNKKIVAITAAMPDGTGLCAFKRRYPKRFFDVGIAEAHAVTFAAGLAKAGMRPVVAVYSTFLQRAYDQIMHDAALQGLPVVFAVSHAGLTGEDGETHQGLYDIAYLSHIPNMTLLAPKNKAELIAMLDFALKHDGPAAIRYPKAEASLCLPDMNTPIEYGRAETIYEGTEVALVSVGGMMDTSLAVVDILKQAGLSVGLYNARFIKPMDRELTSRLRRYPIVAVLSDSVKAGGYGAQLAAVWANDGAQDKPVLYDFAFPDAFIEQGARAQLFARYKLNADAIASSLLNQQNEYRKED